MSNSGESGSGKTTVRSHLLTALLNKTSTPLSNKVSMAAYIFDTLTTTKTATTPTASKAGLFYELQYDTSASTRPHLIGAKLLDHRLERSRIADVPTGERNFHVLYYLLSGTGPAEKTHLGLDQPGTGQKRWRYLGHPTQLKVGINDAEGFQMFKTALRKLEFPRSEVAEICQILACILHIGQLEFETSNSTTATGDDSGGFSHEGGQTSTVVKNKDVLGIVAAFLGLASQDLQTTLGYKTKMIHKERVTVLLDPAGARANANELARTLYSLLVAWVIEAVNQKLCASEDSIANTISIVDFPGFSQQSSTHSALDQLLNNAATESLYNLTLKNFFDNKAELLESEEVAVAATSYFDNSDATKGLLKPGNGLLSILDDQTRRHRTDMQFLESLRKRFESKNPAISISSATAKLPGSNFYTENTAASFTVRHFAGEVEYPVKGLVEENGEVISGDLMNLINSTKSEFVARLFGQEALQTVVHPSERTTVMQATVSSKPMRQPSVMSRKNRPRPGTLRQRGTSTRRDDASEKGDEDSSEPKRSLRHSEQGASGQFLSALENVTKSITALGTNAYFVFCLKPNDRRIANQFDSKCVRTQVQTFGIAEISQRLRSADFSIFLPFAEFLGAADADTILVGSDREKVELVVEEKRWPSNEVQIGSTGVFLSERCWMEIASLGEGESARLGLPSDNGDSVTPGLASSDPFAASKERLLSVSNTPNLNDKHKSGYFGSNDVDARSDAGGSNFGNGDLFKNLETREEMAQRSNEKNMEEVEEYRDSGSRRRWVFFVLLLTWFVPDFLIRVLGKMPRKDVRQAWREKLAINFIIWLSCGIAVFFIIGLPLLICPKQYVYSSAELTQYDSKHDKGAYVAIRGIVLDLNAFQPNHYPSLVTETTLKKFAGKDITSMFPVQVSAMCQGVNASGVDQAVTLEYTSVNSTTTDTMLLYSKYHDFRYFTNDSRPDWFTEQIMMLKSQYKKGNIGYTSTYVKKMAEDGSSVAILDGRIYDLTDYVTGGRTLRAPPGETAPTDNELTMFMDDLVVQLFTQRKGEDVSKLWTALDIDDEMRTRQKLCLDNLYYIADVDTRNSVKCQFADYLILAVSILLCCIIGVKFFAAMQFGGHGIPENLDKFIICQIPAYTEDEDSLRRAIDSAARMKYDDKRKLLAIICDGMIIGQGNDKPTPRIVLDILGVSDTVDPEPLSFESLGEGLKQHNMGKVYSGLYEVQGHIVPFLVIVKVGKPSEVSRPGNRGKRDSQMVLMRFLNRVHYNLAMSPMELEMYHQIRNIIGVNPTFYEYLLQMDADTVVAPDSASRFVSSFLDDVRLIAICGETALTNAKGSFVTMIQVYEYYISHNLVKAFESLFGSVTCLPGCFTMYRIRAAETGKPLFVSREVVEAYSTIRVDTLHMKNLLHLGEDRYLTTLLLKHHNKYKTKYLMKAHAWTIAPDSWAVFLSQRRRWINSTVHNLAELIPMGQLCGFCCFSMRFVVFMDLLTTVVQPVTIAYFVYLIALIIMDASVVGTTAFIMLGAIYGLQAIIFIIRRKWEMIGWMLLYIVAVPVYSFGLPLYAFWNMDDFNWGNTRVVAGEKGKKVVISDEGKFDPASIPRKKWEEYQAELWDAQTARDDVRSEVSGYSYATKAGPQVGVSEYGWGGFPPSRPGSVAGYAHSPYNTGSGDLKTPLAAGNQSRLSFASSEMLGGNGAASTTNLNRMSQFGGSQFFGGSQHELEMSNLAGMPSDDALLAEIREILRTADLMTVTKKGVKAELERRFGVPLDARRAYINSGKHSSPSHEFVSKTLYRILISCQPIATEACLSGQL